MIKLHRSSLVAAIAVLIGTPALAISANFNNLKLSPGFPRSEGMVTGYTSGSYSLSAIANRDRHNRPCIGFAAPQPDHIMVLEQDFPQLKVQVDTGGRDTTLVIRKPDGTILCGDDTATSKDALIQDSNWQRGEYQIWIGSILPDRRWNYTLRVEQ